MLFMFIVGLKPVALRRIIIILSSEFDGLHALHNINIYIYVCVCVCERERERERELDSIFFLEPRDR